VSVYIPAFRRIVYAKQRNSKRPLFHFEVFSSKNVIAGMILFFIFYLIRSGLNNVYSIMATVWKWPWDYIVNIQYWNVAGTLLGVFLSGICLVKGFHQELFSLQDFFCLAIDCAWFTYTFYPDTTLLHNMSVLFLQGVAQGLLFTPLVFFNFRNA
jgi:hypothetical protein